MHKLQALQRKVLTLFAGLDIVVVPTAPTTYKVSEIEAEPIKLNSRLGTYTNFMNLLDMAGLAIPAGIGKTGLPFGITLAAPAFSEAWLIDIGARFHAALDLAPGAPSLGEAEVDEGFLEIAVVGAHMTGLPLNPELTSRGGMFVERTKTAACYRFYALAGGPPFRPGLVKSDRGAAIELEVWRLPRAQVGSFLAGGAAAPRHRHGRSCQWPQGEGLSLRSRRPRRRRGHHALWRLAPLPRARQGEGGVAPSNTNARNINVIPAKAGPNPHPYMHRPWDCERGRAPNNNSC